MHIPSLYARWSGNSRGTLLGILSLRPAHASLRASSITIKQGISRFPIGVKPGTTKNQPKQRHVQTCQVHTHSLPKLMRVPTAFACHGASKIDNIHLCVLGGTTGLSFVKIASNPSTAGILRLASNASRRQQASDSVCGRSHFLCVGTFEAVEAASAAYTLRSRYGYCCATWAA